MQVTQVAQMAKAPIAAPVWDYKEEWWAHGRDFLVIVKRHSGTADESMGDGPHRWNVYAFIYPRHPHFANFDGDGMWQDAATCMPLHSYPSLLNYPMYEGKVTSVKVGSDYHHLHDERFTFYATKEEAGEVFADAEALHRWLTERAAPQSPPTP